METESQINERLFNMLMDKEEISWQTMVYDLVRSEQMDTWDINISLLSERFLQAVKMMKEMDLRVSGKVILAAAILLRIKSNKFVGEDISHLDSLFAQTEEQQEEEGLLDEEEVDNYADQRQALSNATLLPRTPQPRKRKVSIYDLVGALQKAMDVKKRRMLREMPTMELELPEKKKDISELILDVFDKIKLFFMKSGKKLTFNQLIPDSSKESKVYTFIPLLHLTNDSKIDLHQYRHFGEIEIELMKQTAKKES